MKHDKINLDSKKVGTIELNKNIFSLPIRKDILKDVVDWQLANRRQGTHKVKQRSEIIGTTANAFKQKGTKVGYFSISRTKSINCSFLQSIDLLTDALGISLINSIFLELGKIFICMIRRSC